MVLLDNFLLMLGPTFIVRFVQAFLGYLVVV